MRLAVTCNGPGETAGWLRPLLSELYARDPGADVHVFFVPDDYATGDESRVVRELFPQAHVYEPRAYLRVALGGRDANIPEGAETVLYLGGDLLHAARLHRRFGGAFAVYKFSRPRYSRAVARAYAVDAGNARSLRQWGVATERIETVGNLAIDGALSDAAAPAEAGAPAGGVLFMPGSRRHEIANLVPFFFTAALAMHREQPSLPIAFAIAPFTSREALRSAIEGGADPRFFARAGKLVEYEGRQYLATGDGRTGFPVLRNAPAAARAAKLAVTIPGTKVIELAALGVPVVSCTPANAPELAVINGPLTYLDRIPLVGIPAKRAIAVAYGRRHRFHTQPNIDAGTEVVCELHGTLTPGRVARVALEKLADEAWLRGSSQALGALYREHVGAAGRMVRSLLQLGSP